MNFDNSIRNILTDSKALEAKISNFRSNILQKDDFLIFEKNQFDLFIDPRLSLFAYSTLYFARNELRVHVKCSALGPLLH